MEDGNQMFEVITNFKKIPHLKNMTTTGELTIDGYKAISPIIVNKDNKRHIVAKHLDRGNLEELKKENMIPANYQIVYFRPYFSFITITPPAQADFMTAMEFVAEGEKKMMVHPDIPVSLYQTLSTRFELALIENPSVSLPYIYKLSREDVLKKFNIGRERADQIALRLITASPDRKELEQYIKNRVDTRFTVLDNLMKSNDLNAVLCTSPLGVQEITGLGITRHKEDGVAAFYTLGSEYVYLFSAEKLYGFGECHAVDSFIPFIKNILGDETLGIEEEHFAYGWVEQFGLKSSQWVNAMTPIRQLRELRGVEDLSYYIIACRAGAYAINNAAAWAKEQLLAENKFTEMDISRKHDAFVQEFREIYHIPFKLDKYWTGLHASNRSVTPSFPFNHPVDKTCKAVKIDAGLSIKDENGIHHACSDIARMVLYEDFAQEVYKKLESHMVNDVIPVIKDGTIVKEIYDNAMNMIEKDRKRLEEIGMIPESNVGQVFKRDCGHVLGKQEPVTLWFDKGNEQVIKEGMICAFEYQWSMQGYSIGVEDVFLVGKNHSINITRD